MSHCCRPPSLALSRAASFGGQAAVAVVLLFTPAVRSFAQPVLPANFQETVALSGLNQPTAVKFASDGRVFVAEKSGLVKVFDSLADPSPDIFADLRTQVHNFWDRGLLGLELHPSFPDVPYVYVLYTLDRLPRSLWAGPGDPPIPQWGSVGGTSDGCPNPPGATGNGCAVTGRLSRLTAFGNSAGPEQALIEDWCQQFPSHSIGALAFGSDGELYVSGGDGASFNYADYGQTAGNVCGDPPVPPGGTQSASTSEGGSLRSQSLRRPNGPAALNGAILRIDPETGEGLPDNPLAHSSDPRARRVVAYGLRNPFRIAVRPGTSELWVGDVGWATWEEVDRIPSPTGEVLNFGWPCYEGNGRQPGYDGLNNTQCENLYNGILAPGIDPIAAGTLTAPFYTYNHNADVVSGDVCPPNTSAPVSSAIAGLAFYRGGPYPGAYSGALFFADYNRDCIWAFMPGAGGVLSASSRIMFVGHASNPVALEIGPDGDLFYVDLDNGTIRRVRYLGANNAPVAVLTADQTSGEPPLTVQFSAAGSSDADDDPLTYAWDLDNDGQFDDGTAVTVSRTFTTVGVYTVRVRVTDDAEASDIDSVEIRVGNAAPTATIATPSASLTWTVGDVIGFSGSATDPQDGPLPGSSLTWTLIINHCPNNDCHQHTIQSWNGASGSFVAPDHEYPSTLELRLTAVDSGGLSDTKSVVLQPQTVALTLAASASGLTLGLNAESAPAPFTRTVIVGSSNSISAPSPQFAGGVTYTFQSWSDEGAASHNVVAPAAATTYTATFTGSLGTLPPGWASADVGDTGAAGSAGYDSGTFTLRGAGSDIWYGADGFHLAYVPLNGDGEIRARVTSLTDTHPWAKAGVMIRQSLTAGSPHAMMAVTPGNGLAFQRRLATGGQSLHTAGAAEPAPYWVRLVRSGSTFSAYSSPDGVAWTLVGSDTIVMSGGVYMGLSLTSHNYGVLATAAIDQVTVSTAPGNTPPTATIDTPASSLTWKVGDTISFSGSATDPEDGSLTGGALTWTLVINHCPGGVCHQHVVQSWNGSSGSFVAPDHEYPATLELRLQAVDSGGLSDTESVTLQPQTVSLTLASSTAGLTLGFNGESAAAPFTRTAIVGSTNTIAAPSPQALGAATYTFQSWSDEGAATHTVTAGAASETFTATFTAGSGGSLPDGWLDADVGSPAAAGSAAYGDGAFTIRGSGSDIWYASDAFHFAYRSLSGDGEILARVASLTSDTHPWAKAGVMIRQSLDAGAPHAMMAVTPGNGLAFQRRLSANADSLNTAGAAVTAPYWVRLVRAGNTLTGYSSPDGVTWTLVGSDTVVMPASVLVGLAITSHNDGLLATAVIDQVSDVSAPGNTAPTATIASPAAGLTWKVGDTIAFSGSASDPEDGALTGAALAWTIVLHDCTSSPCHQHQVHSVTGDSGSFVAPDHQYPSTLEVRLQATDSGGLSDTTTVTLQPQTVVLTLAASAAGLTLAFNGESGTAPLARTAIIGSSNTIAAPTPQSVSGSTYTFESWSDAGAATHSVIAPAANQTYTATFTVTGGGGTLPSGWLDTDVGSPAIAGSATYDEGAFTVRGSGSDIWNAADAFHFAYQSFNGDGEIRARVASLTGDTHPWAKAGVMIRQTLDEGSPHAMMAVTPGNGVTFQRRTAANGQSLSSSGAAVTAPYWMRLVRSGNTVTGYSSPDGTTWTPVGTASISMPSSVYVGLPITSHNDSVLATAVIDQVTIASGEPPPPPPPPPPPVGAFQPTDIGDPGVAGSTSLTGSTYTVQGGGGDIWNTSDAFHFAQQAVTGDVSVIARVDSLQNTHVWAKAGVMIRESLASDARHVLMAITPGSGSAFQRRTAAGGVSLHTSGPAVAAPYWVRLVRSGSTFTAAVSTDGSTWTTVGSETIGMSAAAYAGLAVTSHDNAVLTTATFSQVTVVP